MLRSSNGIELTKILGTGCHPHVDWGNARNIRIPAEYAKSAAPSAWWIADRIRRGWKNGMVKEIGHWKKPGLF